MTDLDAAPATAPAEPADAAITIVPGDNLPALQRVPSGSVQLVYLDPPFNTGRTRSSELVRATAIERSGQDDGAADADAPGVRGFRDREYARVRTALHAYDDRFEDYWAFLEPRLRECWRALHPSGTLYLHLDYREAHYAKVLMDALFGRDRFLNEIVWAYDYGAKPRRRWPAKHDTILVYVKDPAAYHFDNEEVEREPYMAPGLVSPEKAARGKLPTDVWWHTIVTTTGRERTGYPTQKPEGILRRILQASSRRGDLVLDPFAGSGTTGAAAAALGRRALLLDANPEAIEVMTRRLPQARVDRSGAGPHTSAATSA